jgi:hypothetical protein
MARPLQCLALARQVLPFVSCENKKAEPPILRTSGLCQLAIAARHDGGEHREQQEEGRFRPEVAADATDSVHRRNKSGVAFERLAPANYRHRWDHREQGDHEEGRDLCPEEYVDLV